MFSRKIFGLACIASLACLTGCLGALPKSSTAQEYESNQRLQEIYEAQAGVFEGVLTQNPNNEPDRPVRLELFVTRQSNGRNEDGEEKFVPVLQATYRRLDVNDVRLRYFIKSVRYYEESGEMLMIVDDKTQGASPGEGYLAIQGRVENKIFTGSVVDHRGPQGILRLEKLASSRTEQ
ncbi:MAG: hypothetical protein ABIR96_06590 [Bdellovibrionota bacterium]